MRYDGGHKRAEALYRHLEGRGVEWISFCPELDAGMGVPREPVGLVGEAQNPRMLGKDTGRDWTLRMLELCRRRVMEFKSMRVSGFVLKKLSPSCGLDRVPVLSATGEEGSGSTGPGLFARVLMQELPGLPVVDEEALLTESGAADFLERSRLYKEQK